MTALFPLCPFINFTNHVLSSDKKFTHSCMPGGCPLWGKPAGLSPLISVYILLKTVVLMHWGDSITKKLSAESLLVYIASTAADYCPYMSLIKIDSAYKIYYHSCAVQNHARQGYFWIAPEWVTTQCWLIFVDKFGWSIVETLLCSQILFQNQNTVSIIPENVDWYQLCPIWGWLGPIGLKNIFWWGIELDTPFQSTSGISFEHKNLTE